MQVQINTGHNIEGREALGAQIKGVVESALTNSAIESPGGSPPQRRKRQKARRRDNVA